MRHFSCRRPDCVKVKLTAKVKLTEKSLSLHSKIN
jgi:hypothetical protein